MQCKHPDHTDATSCEDRAVGCHKDCKCCCPDEVKQHYIVVELGEMVDGAINVNSKTYVKAYIKTNYSDEVNRFQVAQYFREMGFSVSDSYYGLPYTIIAHITDNKKTLQPILYSPTLKLYAQ